MNDLDGFHLIANGIDRVPQLGPKAAYAKQAIRDKLIIHGDFRGNLVGRVPMRRTRRF